MCVVMERREARLVALPFARAGIWHPSHKLCLLPHHRQSVTEADVAAARRDDARIRQFFAAYTKPEKVRLQGRGLQQRPHSCCSCACTPHGLLRGKQPAHLLTVPQVARECQALTDACEFLVADRWGQRWGELGPAAQQWDAHPTHSWC